MDKKILEYLEIAKRKECEVCIWGAGNIGINFGRTLMKKWGIEPDFYCDNDLQKWDKEICNGIKCYNPNILLGKNAICFVLVSNHYCEDISKQAKEYGVKVVTYNDLCVLEGSSYFSFQNRNRVAIYTCIVGDYDEVQEPDIFLDGCDYYIISDKQYSGMSRFKYLNIYDIIPQDVTNLTKMNRYCKINAHKIFPQYKYSVYFDGNIKLKGDITEKFVDLPKSRIITICKNFFDSIYVEAMRAIEHGRDSKDIITRQVEKYWLEGMPDNFGSVACAILLREHNNPICVKIMEDWWEELKKYSKRDQISFPYVIWKNGYTIEDVGTLNNHSSIDGKYWYFSREHSKSRV